MTHAIDLITDHALAAWLWSEVDLDGNPMDGTYSVSDVAPEERTKWREEIANFVTANAEDLNGIELEQIGHDFTLTRNGHGAGFWDRGLGERGQRLTDACGPFGGADAFESTDGKVRRM